MTRGLGEVYVATCDDEIAEVVENFGGKVIRTANTHKNGTTRIAEAVKEIDCTHVILLQGDEPLLLPRHVASMIDAIKTNPNGKAWNATGPIEHESELDRHSFVKCAVTAQSRIMFCFRRTPGYSDFEKQKKFIRKILGLMAFEKKFLLNLTSLEPAVVERYEFIEQMRIIENGYYLDSVPVSPSLPSVNEPKEADIVLNYIKSNKDQYKLLNKVIEF